MPETLEELRQVVSCGPESSPEQSENISAITACKRIESLRSAATVLGQLRENELNVSEQLGFTAESVAHWSRGGRIVIGVHDQAPRLPPRARRAAPPRGRSFPRLPRGVRLACAATRAPGAVPREQRRRTAQHR